MKITVVGGTYKELCFEPHWNKLYGSGLRACEALLTSETDLTIDFFTFADRSTSKYLEAYGQLYSSIRLHIFQLARTIEFQYDYPLRQPLIRPRLDLFSSSSNYLEANGENMLVFGFIEGAAKVSGTKVVYDPQSPVNPRLYSSSRSSAASLTYVLNLNEAGILSGEQKIEGIKKFFFENEQVDVLVLKMGPKGALVSTPEEEQLVPVYKTEKVWNIGSGDVFAAMFAYYWFKGETPFVAAQNASLLTAAYCNSKTCQQLPINYAHTFTPLKINSNIEGQIYLAGPFFTFAERWLINQVRNAFEELGLRVFSPWHDVGHGVASEVVGKDLLALENSAIVFAILDGLDSGTLFEIGYAIKKGLAVIGYVENESTESVKMLDGTQCLLEKDLTTAIYKCYWKLAELS